MKQEGAFVGFFKRLKSDYAFRTFCSAVCSFAVTLIFTGYNVFLAVRYRTSWNAGIAIYYALLVFIRACVFASEYRYRKAKLPPEVGEKRRAKLFLFQNASLFVIDFALITPISMMVLQQKSVAYSLIPAIAMAAYTVYKVTLSVVNYVKTRKSTELGVRMLKTVNVVDALVSVLTLQYTLIMVMDGGIEGEMFILCACTSFAIWGLLLVLSAVVLARAVKYHKNALQSSQNEV